MTDSVRLLVVVSVLFCGARAGAANRPVAVSPGADRGLSFSAPCPTFDWGGVAGALSYELVVFRVGETGAAEAPEITHTVTGAALGWTPSLDRCLDRDRRYVWSIRAQTSEGLSDWSAPLFFDVPARPSESEVAAALETVRRYYEPELAADGSSLVARERSRSSEAAELPTDRESRLRESGSATAGHPTASFTVVGEARTVDSGGEPRLWGKGRPGVDVFLKDSVVGDFFCNNNDVKFGLSNVDSDWGAAADACPAGTWVCRLSDVSPCNTKRPDSSGDATRCDGTGHDFPSTAHVGWLAQRAVSAGMSAGQLFSEDGVVSGTTTCESFPVWCCWE